MREKIRNLSAIALALALGLAVVACGSSAEPAAAPAAPQAPAAPAAPQASAPAAAVAPAMPAPARQAQRAVPAPVQALPAAPAAVATAVPITSRSGNDSGSARACCTCTGACSVICDSEVRRSAFGRSGGAVTVGGRDRAVDNPVRRLLRTMSGLRSFIHLRIAFRHSALIRTARRTTWH